MKSFFIYFCFLSSILCFSQQEGIKGTIKDASTGETLIGANVMIGKGKGAVTDIDGNYFIKLDSNGTYTLQISFVGYDSKTTKIKYTGKTLYLNFSLATQMLNEVEVVADVAKTRETPVAFSNISIKKIEEELGGRDLPMLLNSTPGVYATEQGGGAGDARVNIRGFDQRNIAVMIDGVPVNDMENGWVYWSNWAGLAEVTQSTQVQRGLGASKLAIASVGGTMNTITKGIDQKRSLVVKQEVGNNNALKTAIGFNSGMLKGGWGVTFAGSRTVGDGWVDQLWTEQWSYFGKIQKRIDNHLLSLSAVGAPQSHGQRINRMAIPIYDREYAKKIGMTDSQIDSVYKNNNLTTPTIQARGRRYNADWGMLNGKPFSERINYFHKPQINLSHFWNASEKLFISNIAYLSIGKGGGTGALGGQTTRDTTTGNIIYQNDFDKQSGSPLTIDNFYSATENKSSKIIRSSINNHYWVGLLSTAIWKIDSSWTYTGGIDLRYYRGMHYQEVYDLLGGDYYINTADKNQAPLSIDKTQAMNRVGDKIAYNNDGIVMWGGLSSQLEFKKEKWSAFATISLSETGYQRIDFFRKKDLVLADTTFKEALGYSDTIIYKENIYTNKSKEAEYTRTDREWFLGYTFKGGANYNINDHHNVFVNIGYMSIAPRFNNVFDINNKKFAEVKMQFVKAVELGYGYRSSKFSGNVNGYYTIWQNKPQQNTPTVTTPDGVLYYNINGLDAIHTGIEFDGVYKVSRKIDLDGIISIADWVNNSDRKVFIRDEDNNVVGDTAFYAKGVHVGDAAQIQLGGGIRYEPIRNLYFKARITYFDKNYANFDPTTLNGKNANRESWEMPSYSTVDFHAGYEFKYWKLRFNLNANVINVLDTKFISDAQNGAKFDAATALVYFGQGRRFNIGLKITY